MTILTQPFEQYKLQPFLLEAIESIGFREPTPIQEVVIPLIQSKKDVIGQSQTGSGKSHAFLLPLINRIDAELNEVQIMVTAPSRELATQLYQSATQLVEKAETPIRIQNYVGGTDKEKQIDKLHNHQPHMVIGTPGRLLDLVQEGSLKAFTTNTLVIDEADMTLDLGFLNEVDKIAAVMPSNLQMLVFSATIPEKLKPFLKKYMTQPEMIQIGSKRIISETISNWLIPVKSRDPKKLIYDIATVGTPYLMLIFANTKVKVDELADYLDEQGLNVGRIHGDLKPRERKREMKKIHNLEYQYVVASDLASRGIDIEGVSHVINAEIPTDLEFFVHRVGRTGRNDMDGIAITLYDPDEREAVEYLENKGIVFENKDLRKGEFVDVGKRQSHEFKEKKIDRYNPEIGRIKRKNKKSTKPGYRNKIKREKDKSRRNQQKRNRK